MSLYLLELCVGEGGESRPEQSLVAVDSILTSWLQDLSNIPLHFLNGDLLLGHFVI